MTILPMAARPLYPRRERERDYLFEQQGADQELYGTDLVLDGPPTVLCLISGHVGFMHLVRVTLSLKDDSINAVAGPTPVHVENVAVPKDEPFVLHLFRDQAPLNRCVFRSGEEGPVGDRLHRAWRPAPPRPLGRNLRRG